jgi:acyl-CoA synthetase (AMP-forming)/AMP-acid ligase II
VNSTDAKSIRDWLSHSSNCGGRFLWSAHDTIPLSALLGGTCLAGRVRELYDRTVLLLAHDQLAAALALIELDGVSRRLIICPAELPLEYLPMVIGKADVDAIVSDYDPGDLNHLAVSLRVRCSTNVITADHIEAARCATEWVLLTSGTTGAPKMVSHNFASLTAPVARTGRPRVAAGTNRLAEEPGVVWGTFYDIRRYGGLQIFLRAILGPGSLVLSSSDESPDDHLLRLSAHSVTHLTGTPSHWRRALMCRSARAIAPHYVRLSGEIADQAILNTLSSVYPSAGLSHAFASTEAGVAFEVNDGLEGFPASFLGLRGEVETRIEDNSLRIRSNRMATGYVGEEDAELLDTEGFVDTGDIVELRDNRYYFLGRRTGVINVGGLKVYPEEIEALLNRHPSVRMSCVRSRRSSIIGSLVVADVVLKGKPDPAAEQAVRLKQEILDFCREALPRHKVPAALNFVPALTVSATGKVTRRHA